MESALVVAAVVVAQCIAQLGGLVGYGLFFRITHQGSEERPNFSKAVHDVASIHVQATAILAYLATIALLLWLLPKVARRSIAALGLSRTSLAQWRPLSTGAALGLALQLVERAYVVAIYPEHQRQTGFEQFAPASPVVSLLVLVVSVILAPIGEELFFSGLIFRALSERLPVTVAALMTGAIFGAIRGDLILFPALMALGVAGALLYYRTGNLWSAIALYATNNAVAFGLMFYGIKPHS